MESPYQVLGVSEDATQSEIKDAFRERAMECHPDQADHLTEKEAKKEFIRVRKAFDVIGNEEKRREYDRAESSEPDPGSSTEPDRYEREWDGFREDPDSALDFIMEEFKRVAKSTASLFGLVIKYTFLSSIFFFFVSALFFLSNEEVINSGPLIIFLSGCFGIGSGVIFGMFYGIYKHKIPEPRTPPWAEDN